MVGCAGQRATHCEVRCGESHRRRRERVSVQKRGKDRASVVTEEVLWSSGCCRSIKLRCGEPAQDNEAGAACQVPDGKRQRGKQAGGVDGEALWVAPCQVPGEGHWQDGDRKGVQA